jgi:hypothetical protein
LLAAEIASAAVIVAVVVVVVVNAEDVAVYVDVLLLTVHCITGVYNGVYSIKK